MGGREWWHLSVGTRKRDRRGKENVRAASLLATGCLPKPVPLQSPQPQRWLRSWGLQGPQ